jgi:Fe2+ transport system protein FeoA
MPDLLPLELVSRGEWARVEQVSGEPNWIGRMAELGIRIGAVVRVLQSGSPCILQIGAARLSLRGDCGSQVLVRLVA